MSNGESLYLSVSIQSYLVSLYSQTHRNARASGVTLQQFIPPGTSLILGGNSDTIIQFECTHVRDGG